MRKILFFSIFFALIFSANNALAYDGSGTTEDPYLIKTAEDLDNVRNYLNSPSVVFKLANDIDLTEFLADKENGWEPIGPEVANHFKGTLDGDGYSIVNMVITGKPDGAGLFGRLGSPGIIKNLNIVNADLDVARWCGILVSTNGSWEFTGGTISNCKVINSKISGQTCIGGIVGGNSALVENCAAIDIDATSLQKSVAGIAAENTGNGAAIKNSFTTGIVSGTEEVGGIVGIGSEGSLIESSYSFCYILGGVNCGGLIGYNRGSIKKCFASGDVEGQSAGGLVGAPNTGSIENSYATGNVLGFEGTDVFSGGLVGALYDCKVSNSYFAGSLEGTATRGGFTGRAIRVEFENTYFDASTAGTEQGIAEGESNVGEPTGLTYEQMQVRSNLEGLFGSGVWDIWEGKSYPYFTNQSAPATITATHTDRMEGTYRNEDIKEISFYTLDYGTINANVNIADGKWTAVFAEGTVRNGDYVNVILLEEGKMHSYAAVGIADGNSGIKGQSVNSSVKIYPNPAIEYITIAADASNVKINISDASGKIVLEKTYSGNNSYTVPVSNLPKGIYFVNITSEQKNVTQKLIIK